mmetsp:Transcript_80636/g.147494  ORF Transcript_80636/g.147494 Transcript_80636/m.147494 type:complete len:477 (+) Transcript_80636:109-1539(+)
MELSVVSHRNIAEGSILSIRSGNIRRQAPLSSGRPFRFPAIAASMKVDVLQPVATGHLILGPKGASEDRSYEVIFPDSVDMDCQIKLQPLSENATPRSPTPAVSDSVGLAPTPPVGPSSGRPTPDLSKRFSAIGVAQEYIKKHELLEFVQTVLQTVIRDKPEDPYSVMSALFRSVASETKGKETQPIEQPKEQPWLSSSKSEEQPDPGEQPEAVVTSKSVPEFAAAPVGSGSQLGAAHSKSDTELEAATKRIQRFQRGRSRERMSRGQRQVERDMTQKCKEEKAKQDAAARKIQSVRRGCEERRKLSVTYGQRAPRSCQTVRSPMRSHGSQAQHAPPITPRCPLSPGPPQSAQAPERPRLSLPDACLKSHSAPGDFFTNQDQELVEQAQKELNSAAQKIQTRHRNRMSLREEELAAQKKALELEKQRREKEEREAAEREAAARKIQSLQRQRAPDKQSAETTGEKPQDLAPLACAF